MKCAYVIPVLLLLGCGTPSEPTTETQPPKVTSIAGDKGLVPISEGSKIEPGDVIQVHGETWIAAYWSACDQLVKSQIAKDPEGIRELYRRDLIQKIDHGTRVRILRVVDATVHGNTLFEIRALEGPAKGTSAWVPKYAVLAPDPPPPPPPVYTYYPTPKPEPEPEPVYEPDPRPEPQPIREPAPPTPRFQPGQRVELIPVEKGQLPVFLSETKVRFNEPVTIRAGKVKVVSTGTIDGRSFVQVQIGKRKVLVEEFLCR